MISFIICDDNIADRNRIEKVVDKFMMSNQFEYKKYLFDDYNDSFLDIIRRKLSFKIYILDIEAPTRSGIDVARIIRTRDINSVLIFLTGHNELVETVAKNDFLFLAFINKFDGCEERLMIALDESLKIFGTKKILDFKDNGTFYTICLDDILYISKDSVERKCTITTDYAEFKIGKTLNEIEKLLDSNFTKSHRSCIINTKRVAAFYNKEKIIKFDTGKEIDIISKTFKMCR